MSYFPLAYRWLHAYNSEPIWRWEPISVLDSVKTVDRIDTWRYHRGIPSIWV